MTEESETTLAKISHTMLGYEDHGILSSFLTLEYAKEGRKIGGSGQGFGGYGLSGPAASVWLTGVLEAVGVQKWEQLIGRFVWAEHTWSKVTKITGLDTGKSFEPGPVFEKMREEAGL